MQKSLEKLKIIIDKANLLWYDWFRKTEQEVKLMFDHRKLIGKIKEICQTQAEFGKLMGWSHTTTTAKLNGITGMTQGEIRKAADILNLKNSEIPSYFFTPKV